MTPDPLPTDAETAASRPAVPSRREAAGSASGVISNNIPPSITSLTRCAGGEDWLELSLYLQHRQFGQLEARLEEVKELAEAPDAGPVEMEIASRSFLVLPGAATVGSRGKQLKYRWRLQAPDGWVLLLMRRALPHATMPNGMARASSLPLLRLGTATYVRQMRETLDDLDIRLVRDKVSRVDPCADLVDVELTPLYQAFQQGHYVTRARHSSDYLVEEHLEGYQVGRRPSGFRLGSGAVRLRVYDKSLECRRDWEKLRLMQTRRWGGIGCDAVRAEFQVRREKLKELGIDSLATWYEKRGSIVEYLSHHWCRMVAGAVDSRHADRTPTHPDWELVQAAFEEWAGAAIAELAPLPKLDVPADDLLHQIIGALCSYEARRRYAIVSNDDFLEHALCDLRRGIADRHMAEEVRLRALKLGVAGQ